jgi:hypothetical protein
MLAIILLCLNGLASAVNPTLNQVVLTPPNDATLVIESFAPQVWQSADNSYQGTSVISSTDGIIGVTASEGVAEPSVVNGLIGAGYNVTENDFTPDALSFYVAGSLTIGYDPTPNVSPSLLSRYTCPGVAFAQGQWNSDGDGPYNWYVFDKYTKMFSVSYTPNQNVADVMLPICCIYNSKRPVTVYVYPSRNIFNHNVFALSDMFWPNSGANFESECNNVLTPNT